MSKIGLIWRTVRYLQCRQLVYQVINRLRRRPRLRLPKHLPSIQFVRVPEADKPVSYENRAFTFLNQSVQFDSEIDWNYAENGKLWTYNFTYFDYLNQGEKELAAGLWLIRQFMAKTDSVAAGLEPYPTSLRIMNWVQFLSRHRMQDDLVNTHLFAQVHLLSRRLEYHLGGNHLLENGFALLAGGLFFRNKSWFEKGSKLLRAELAEQILLDGAHAERSPMYHQILLGRLLDVLIMLQDDTWHGDSALVELLTTKAVVMLRWLTGITFSNGDVPMVNDAAFGIAPTTEQIQKKAEMVLPTACSERLTRSPQSESKESGYRLFRYSDYEFFADVGAVGPDYQPGHAHADTFSFVLYVHGQPVIVDSGTSTYQSGLRRSWERSTAAHNTVEVNGTDSSEVWAGFRVGRRAYVTLLVDEEAVLSAQHDGYSSVGITHQRTWHFEPTRICILDQITRNTSGGYEPLTAVARLHFHPDVALNLTDGGVDAGPLTLTFQSDKPPIVVVKSYDMATGFNQLRTAHCLEITFANCLNTLVTLAE
ncbi:alginate lyase family protein [Spirosoma oryzicola]|uniref:alginate lyase family protein n=1 Tax=Spirosoma oryzicola TaxID=2898794 RepID=UPI001E350E75|nr:alginate lyase family protein [Spirosoma oryzicola]UHG92571.1 heparinase II/III family protein [Spirosoma oryzicola]